jgi:hypothetical protein
MYVHYTYSKLKSKSNLHLTFSFHTRFKLRLCLLVVIFNGTQHYKYVNNALEIYCLIHRMEKH